MFANTPLYRPFTHIHGTICYCPHSPLLLGCLLLLPRRQIWDKKVRNGHIKRITDQDIQSSVLEIMGTNVSTNFITCPAGRHM